MRRDQAIGLTSFGEPPTVPDEWIDDLWPEPEECVCGAGDFALYETDRWGGKSWCIVWVCRNCGEHYSRSREDYYE